MRIEQLKYFVEIANTGSFSAAAERLHMTQPSLSQAIAKLEKELNVKLFERSRTGIQLTSFGQSMLQKAQNIINMINEIEDEAKASKDIVTGKLIIASIPSMCTAYLTEVLSVFKKRHPRVRIEVKEEGTNQIFQDILASRVDIGIISCLPEDGIEQMSKIEFGRLLTGTYMVCIGKHSAIPLYNPMPPEIISEQPIITFQPSYRQVDYLKRILKRDDLNILFTFGNTEVAKKVISKGLAIGFYPDFSIQKDSYVLNGEIIPLHIANNELELWFGWIRLKNHPFSRAAQEFIKVLKEVLHSITAVQEARAPSDAAVRRRLQPKNRWG